MTNIALSERFAIVAGATAGWGPSVATRLADRGMGLMLLGPDAGQLNKLAEKLSGKQRRVLIQTYEPGVPGGLRRVIREAKYWLPGVDVVVSNAAPQHVNPGNQLRLEDVGSAEYTSPADSIDLAREFLPAMIRNRWGRVVFLAPRTSKRDMERLAGDCSSGPEFLGLTRRLAVEVGRAKATVNTITQSWAPMGPARNSLREQCRCLGLPQSSQKSVLTAQAVAARLLEGGDIPLIVEYLLSTDGGCVNGLMIPVASEAAAVAVA